MSRKSAFVLLIVLLLTLLAGCHTVHGVGEDVESAGKSIERATDKK